MSLAVYIWTQTCGSQTLNKLRGDLASTRADLEEVIKLRRRVEELEGELGRLRLEPPSGTDDLASGEMCTSIRFRFRVVTSGGSVVGEYDREMEATWNSLFGHLGPALVSHGTELDLRHALRKMIEEYARIDVNTGNASIAAESLIVSDDDFNRIMVQLRALGLTMGAGQSGHGDSYRWRLTPYGEFALTKLLAVRKDQQMSRLATVSMSAP